MISRVVLLVLALADCDRVFGLDRDVPIDAPVFDVPAIDAPVTCTLEMVPVDLSVSVELAGIAAGELTGDADVDLVVVNAQNGSVTVLEGNGDGTFGSMIELGLAGAGSRVVAVLRADDDGNQDIVTSNPGSNDLTLVLRSPPGYAPPVTEQASNAPTAIAVGQLNSNERPDLAVTNVGNGSITIHLGKSPSAFSAFSSLGAPGVPQVVAIADVNGDTKGDVINGSMDGSARMFFGDGAGNFGSAANLPMIGAGPSALVAAPFGGSMAIDLAFVGIGMDRIEVFTNNGSGTMSGPALYPVGVDPVDMIAVDITQDGLLDLITANRGSGTLSILEGAADGTFQIRNAAPGGNTPSGLVSADFNGDGRPDLAVANGTAGKVTVLLDRCVP